MDLKKKGKRLAHIAEVAMTYKYSDLKKTREYYIRYYDQTTVDKQVVLYEVRDGQSITDSPLAIFRYLATHETYRDLKHVWVVTDTSSQNLKRMVANIPTALQQKIIWVKRNTTDYAKWLLAAKYLITNSTFQSFWHKKPDQVYINTWHGTPLKYMGYDIPGSKTSLKNVQRNLLMADYIISPNKHTSHVFLDRYKLNGLYQGEVLEGGYPRIDLTYADEHAQTFTYLHQHQVIVDETKPVVMYTPTWKGTSISNPSGSINQIYEEIKVLQQLNPDKNILVKVHPYAYQLASRHQALKQYLVPDEMDANLILGITDILITDYSSIFFDFMVTDKPIIFYAWDHELYSHYRGMYFNDDELPGPILDDIEEVGQKLQHITQSNQDDATKYQALKNKVVPYDDGHVTERMVATIFAQQSVNGVNHLRAAGLNKPKILIYPGGMGNNGITTSAINLSYNLDYDHYDVTYLLWDNEQPEIINNVDQLDERVRLIYRFGVTALTRPEHKQDRYVSEHGIKDWADNHIPKQGYLREVDRLFNSVQFDTLIDFSGYSYNGSKLFTVMPRKQLVVYQHNDLYADSQKVIDGKKVHAKKLGALFTLYPVFDKIVSVSETLKQINQKKLAKYVRPEQMVAVPNSLTLPGDNKENETHSAVVIEDYQAPAKANKFAMQMFHSLIAVSEQAASTIQLKPKDTIRVLGRAQIKQHYFYKLAINDLPRGWVMGQDIVVQENNELLDQQSHNQIGWVYNNKRRLFKTPYLKGSDTADVIGQAKWLNHTFVKIVAQADTADGRYYQVQLPQQAQLGWLKASSVLPMQMGKHFAIYQWLWNQLSHKVPEQQYDVGIRQLFTILEPAVLTNQPLGLTKRGLKQRQLTTINQFYLATAVAKTKLGTYYRVKVGKKQWWIDAKSVKLQVVNVPLQVSQSIVLQDYLENALILNAVAKDKVQDAFGLIPADLQIIAGYATAKFIGDQQVYELKSESLGEQISLPITMVTVLDTSHFNYYYVVTKAFEATYYRTLVDKQAQPIVIADQIIELARVWNWETNDFMIFALIANQYVWIAESIIHHKHVKQTMFEEDKLVDEQSGVQLEADVLPVDEVKPVSMLAKPWITRKIDMHVADNHFISLIRQNGMTTLVTDDGQKRKIADIHQGISKQLIYANGRNWATYEHFVFVAVGRLSPEKNQTMLLDAFAKVYQQHPEAELIIVGDGVIRGDLEKQAVQLGIADVVLFTGQVDNPADYLAVADVFVHPSLYEGQPMVLLEAMMQHRLIVATNIAANVGVLGNQTYGLLTQDVTTDAFVSQMLFAIEQQTEIAEFDIKHYQNDARLAFYNIIK